MSVMTKNGETDAGIQRSPHPATMLQRKIAPHPATVAQPRPAQPGKVTPPPPHPATVAQRRASSGDAMDAGMTRPPHPATVLQRRPAPHPAEVLDAPHPDAVIQEMRKGGGGSKKPKKPSTAAKRESTAERSFRNLIAYRPGWVRKNDITQERVSAFVKTYRTGVRGHASGDSSKGEQGNTTADCLAYKSWHTQNYGWR